MSQGDKNTQAYFVRSKKTKQSEIRSDLILANSIPKENSAKRESEAIKEERLLSSPIIQNMFNHVVHPHPHRRHYPHHLLDHFSKNLTHQSPTSTSFESTVRTQDSSPVDLRYQTETENSEMLVARGSVRAETDDTVGGDTSERNIGSRTKQVPEQESSVDRAYSNFREPQPWPFFGTESRVLPSGRRVSFLKQACIGFSLTNTRNKATNDNSPTVCPKAFREATFSNTPRRSPIRGGPKVSELRQKFTSTAESPTKQPSRQSSVDLIKFRNESMRGPSERLHGNTVNQEIKTCVTIIDSSSTKGKNPVPKASSLRSSVKPVVSPKPKTKTVSTSPMRHKTKQFQNKSTSPSPTRRKESPPSWKTTGVDKTTVCPPGVRSNSRGPKIVVPKADTPPEKAKPITENVVAKTYKPMTAPPKLSKNENNTKPAKKQTQVRPAKDDYSASSDSLSKESSLVVVDGGVIDAGDITSTYEELSVEASELSDRNFLIDYGDPSRFYFRNEWEARMRELDGHTTDMREKLSKFCNYEEMYQGAIEIIEDVENMKEEMSELYDYFDHFEREEDTLLQQVQRQLTQANRYCKVLHYRVERAQQQRADDKKVHELEEELKLSRQVAVSLHWELQAADARQAKLEQENIEMRHRLLQAETSRETLKIQVTRLQNSVDQMSLHAPSQMIMEDNSNGLTTSDSSSEMKRQLQFMEEKDEVMLSRLVDLQAEKDSLKDELEQYKDQYGELATVPSSGANRHTDLKLRLKLAEDQAGLLARKVIELQLENDNMIKMAAERELMAKEAMKRNPSVSDLQFLEDERESLRLALDEMEIENQKLAAELLRYKQAVHRQLHSNSISSESPLDVGVMLRVPRSNDSIFEDENNNKTSRSHKSDSSHHDSMSEHIGGDRKKLRPLSLTSPLNQTSNQKRSSKMSISRTLSDIAIPLSPDTKSQSVQITPTISSNTPQGPKSTTTTSCRRKSFCHKCKRTKKLKMVDVAIETENEYKTTKQTPVKTFTKSVATCTHPTAQLSSRSQATSPIITNLQSLFQPALDVVTQIRQRKRSMKSEATSPIRGVTPSTSSFALSPMNSGPRPHNALLDEMRKQLANVRHIAESMDNVVNVEAMDVELERKGRELVKAECKKVTERVLQKTKIAKLAKSLQNYVKEMEVSVADESERSESLDGALSEVNGWNLHGNAGVLPGVDAGAAETSTITLSSSTDDLMSLETVRSFATRIRSNSIKELGLGIFEGIILLVMSYVLLTSLPASAMFKICFLILVFFVC
ncbi:uncharacterized protein LOC120341666 isoform X1 [Styela clava]